MKSLELKLDKISHYSKTREKENFEFRFFLKGEDSEEVDKIVHRLHKEITAQIDCQECGNCCKSLRPGVSFAEIEKLAKIDGLSPAEYVSKYVELDQLEGMKYLKDAPCRYLDSKSCSIYADRPKDCRSYPHTHKKDFTSRTLGIIDNYGICPIVFNLFEQLKRELGFKW